MDLNQLEKNFNKTINNLSIKTHFLKNANGIKVGICNYGARITHFIIPQNNKEVDIVLGFNNIEDYFKEDEYYYGVTVGRFANRIAKGKLTLNDETFQLAINNGGNCLHSGKTGFHNVAWEIISASDESIELKYISPDGESGFPGELTCTVKFSLGVNNDLKIHYNANSTKDTVVNLTNHSYFNLNGDDCGILNHQVRINAKYYLPINSSGIPTGEYAEVSKTPFDFRVTKKLGLEIENQHPQIIIGKGYDHSFKLEKEANELTFAASARGDLTNIKLEVFTTEPGMQLYTGNYLGGDKGKNGIIYKERSGFCFETQHYPNSPNQPKFPSTLLKAGDLFKSTTVFKIS